MIKSFTTSIYTIIKPLIGLMLRNGVAFGDFLKLAKQAYVEETEKELLASGQKATTSRIAIITGLTRKDVAALRKEKEPIVEHSSQYNRATRVISAWLSDPDFCDEQGKQRELDIHGSQDSFEALVSRYSGDMPYRAMLDELLRTEAVELTDTGKVTLVRAANIPSTDEAEKYALLGEDVALLISTIKHNIVTEDTQPRYQRKVCYDKIPQEHLAAFQELANTENQKLLIKLNKWLAKHDMDMQPTLESENPMKAGVGIYYFEEPATRLRAPRDKEGIKNAN